MSSASDRLDPLTVLRDTASRFRRLGMGDPTTMVSLTAIYEWESLRLDDLISLCDGTATSNASADTLPVGDTENTEGASNEQT